MVGIPIKKIGAGGATPSERKLSMPTGFWAGTPGSKRSHGMIARSTTPAVVTPAASHATGRQRGESSRPCGKSNSKNVMVRVTLGNQTQVPTQVEITPPGSEPGFVTRA